MKRRSIVLPFMLLLLLCFNGIYAVKAQEACPWKVSIVRRMGYGAGNNLQGQMRLAVKGEGDTIRRVTYMRNELEMASLNEAPFVFDFSTDNYPEGAQSIYAMVEDESGHTCNTAPIELVFLSAADANRSMWKIMLPILAISALIVLLSFAFSFFPKAKGANRPVKDYGPLGGYVCPRCGRPFPRRLLFTINLGFKQLERCPHCGKWSILSIASADELRQSEARYEAGANSGPVVVMDETEKEIRDELEDSKFTNL